jgi:hypothetical protein
MRARPRRLTVTLLWTLLVVATTAALMHLPIGVSFLTLSLSLTGLVAVPEDERRAKAERIREALSILRIPITTAARQYMQMDPADLERGLTGERKLDAWRLEMLGPEFQRVLALLTLRDLGLPALARTAIKIEPMLQHMKESA